MKLLSSLKPKKRYVVFEIVAEQKFSVQDVEKVVFQALLTFLGELGVSNASPMFIKGKNQKFMLKVNNKYVKEVQAAVILIKTIKNNPVIIKSLITTGTIKKANTFLE